MPNPDICDEEALYEIRIKGHLDQNQSSWLDGLAIELQTNGETLLADPVRDQAALHGLPNKIRDLGLPLLGVEKK